MIYKIMSQNGDRKKPICEKRFKSWSNASWEMGMHGKQSSFYIKSNLHIERMEVSDKHFEYMHDGRKPEMISRVEFDVKGYPFRYWVEIVER